jgi:hypothetical protein
MSSCPITTAAGDKLSGHYEFCCMRDKRDSDENDIVRLSACSMGRAVPVVAAITNFSASRLMNLHSFMTLE